MEYYRKVFIKSAEDLPKKSDMYIVGINGEVKDFPIIIDEEDAEWSVKNIDWYLLSVELPSDEEKEPEAKEVDTNTPFFGNSGAKIPMKEVKAKERTPDLDCGIYEDDKFMMGL